MAQSVQSPGKFSIRHAIGSFQLASIAGLTLILFLLLEIYEQIWIRDSVALTFAVVSFAISAWINERFWAQLVAEMERQMGHDEEFKFFSWGMWLPLCAYMNIVIALVMFGNILTFSSKLMVLMAPAAGAIFAMGVGLVALSKESFVKELRR